MGRTSVPDAIDANKVAQLFSRGATIVVDLMEYVDEKIGVTCESISDCTGLIATASVYVTPACVDRLNPHTDI